MEQILMFMTNTKSLYPASALITIFTNRKQTIQKLK